MTNFIVVKHSDNSGYTLKNIGTPQPWIVGPGQTCGWYRLKRDAVKRANELNSTPTDNKVRHAT